MSAETVDTASPEFLAAVRAEVDRQLAAVLGESAERRLSAVPAPAPEPMVLRLEDGRSEYLDLDRDLDDILQGRGGGDDILAMIEKHQIRISPMQRRALLYMMNGTKRQKAYAYLWLDIAGREGNASDYIAYQEAKTLAIPEMNRTLSFQPQG